MLPLSVLMLLQPIHSVITSCFVFREKTLYKVTIVRNITMLGFTLETIDYVDGHTYS